MWHNFSGYVMIRMDGFSLEKLLNRMLQADIPVWNVQRLGAACMTAEICPKDFLRIRGLKKGLRCRIHVVERHGLPFRLARFRFRKAMVAGLFLGALFVFIASTRLWAIKIEGLYEVPQSAVERLLRQQGIRRGMSLGDIIPAELGDAIRTGDERIAWAGIRMEGVALTLQIVEAEPIPVLPDKSLPADVVAGKAGIIEQITALTGRSAVKQGDAVRRGDTLIRGNITKEGAIKSNLVYAEGDVLARVYYVAEETVYATRKALLRSGESMPYRALYIAGAPMFQSGLGYAHYEVEHTEDMPMRGLVLPLRYIKGICFELTEQALQMESEEVYAEALFRAEMAVLWEVPQNARILEQKSVAIQNPDGSFTATAVVCTLEQIGEPSIIIVSDAA